MQPEKLDGTEFSDTLGRDDVAKGLYRLGVVYGQPFGSDKDGLRQLVAEWHAALADIPPAMFAQAITDWIATEKKWPRPSDIREKAAPKVAAAATRAGSASKVHERRLQPVGQMINYPYMRSKLRANKQWADFLDIIHPTAEHNYFVEAMFARNSYEISVPMDWRKDYIVSKLGDQMFKHFGRSITVRVDASQPYDRIPHSNA